MKHLVLIFLLLLGLAPASRAQFGRFVWQANIGTAAKRESGSQMIRLRRGGYLICGSHDTLSFVPVIYLAKVSEQGTVQWQRSYSFTGFFGVDGVALAENRSGQVLVSGVGYDSTGTGSSLDAVLMLVDSSGQRLWKKEYHSPLVEYIPSISLDTDGRFVALATMLGQQNIWRMDSTGTIVQAVAAPGIYPLLPLGGGYAGVISERLPYPGYNQMVFFDNQLVETSRGDSIPIWFPDKLARDSQGNYLLVHGGRISKISPQGDSVWTKLYGMSGSYVGVRSVAETRSNSYIALGKRLFGSQNDLVLLELARDGTVLRDTTLTRFAGSEYPGNVVLDAQGNYVILGWTDNGPIGGTGSADIFLMKIRPFQPVGVAEPLAADAVTLYPNPATDVVRLHSVTPLRGELTLRDLTGRVVRRQACDAAGPDAVLPLTGLSPGLYLLTLTTSTTRVPHTWRVVKQ